VIKTGLFKRKKETRVFDSGDALLCALLNTDVVTRPQALNIPSVSACVELIGNTVAMLPIKLYKEVDGEVTEIKNDPRVALLNDNTGDILNGYQFKKALTADYLLDGAGYAYINRVRNDIVSLHYVARQYTSFNVGTDPIFKRCDILVNGETYRDWQFLKITRNTEDGVRGHGIVEENNLILSVAYTALKYENILNKTGGNKKGFLKSEKKLDPEAFKQVKEAYTNLYKGNTENVMILNNGLEFQEMASSSVEMQMNENKVTNGSEICKIFNVPLGNSSTDTTAVSDYQNFVKLAVLPVLNAIESAANNDLLLPSEKKTYYWAFDTKEVLKASIKERYEAYQIALNAGFEQVDEVRNREDLPPLGMDFVKIGGLDSIFYNPKTKGVYIPNTKETVDMNAKATKMAGMGGGDNNENRDTGKPGNS
jgi:HK97 family phage portal protein